MTAILQTESPSCKETGPTRRERTNGKVGIPGSDILRISLLPYLLTGCHVDRYEEIPSWSATPASQRDDNYIRTHGVMQINGKRYMDS